jgi:hypothetical protein
MPFKITGRSTNFLFDLYYVEGVKVSWVNASEIEMFGWRPYG